jgi:hypothetical protein
MGDAFAGGKASHLALAVLTDFAAALTEDFFFLENRFAAFEKCVASGGVSA